MKFSIAGLGKALMVAALAGPTAVRGNTPTVLKKNGGLDLSESKRQPYFDTGSGHSHRSVDTAIRRQLLGHDDTAASIQDTRVEVPTLCRAVIDGELDFVGPQFRQRLTELADKRDPSASDQATMDKMEEGLAKLQGKYAAARRRGQAQTTSTPCEVSDADYDILTDLVFSCAAQNGDVFDWPEWEDYVNGPTCANYDSLKDKFESCPGGGSSTSGTTDSSTPADNPSSAQPTTVAQVSDGNSVQPTVDRTSAPRVSDAPTRDITDANSVQPSDSRTSAPRVSDAPTHDITDAISVQPSDSRTSAPRVTDAPTRDITDAISVQPSDSRTSAAQVSDAPTRDITVANSAQPTDSRTSALQVTDEPTLAVTERHTEKSTVASTSHLRGSDTTRQRTTADEDITSSDSDSSHSSGSDSDTSVSGSDSDSDSTRASDSSHGSDSDSDTSVSGSDSSRRSDSSHGSGSDSDSDSDSGNSSGHSGNVWSSIRNWFRGRRSRYAADTGLNNSTADDNIDSETGALRTASVSTAGVLLVGGGIGAAAYCCYRSKQSDEKKVVPMLQVASPDQAQRDPSVAIAVAVDDSSANANTDEGFTSDTESSDADTQSSEARAKRKRQLKKRNSRRGAKHPQGPRSKVAVTSSQSQ